MIELICEYDPTNLELKITHIDKSGNGFSILSTSQNENCFNVYLDTPSNDTWVGKYDNLGRAIRCGLYYTK